MRLSPKLLDLGWGKGWASYFTSHAAFEDIRYHFRKFLMVQVQGGEELYFRFYDREYYATSFQPPIPAMQWSSLDRFRNGW